MSSTREQIPPRCKRQRTEAGSLDDASESQPLKQLKSSIRPDSAAFHDSLSNVWLTRRALKELDQRTQVNRPQLPASTLRRVTRNTSKEIQRFAENGGPELRDLRGYPAPRNVARTMSSRTPSGSRPTRSTVPTNRPSNIKRSSAYDKNFEQHLTDHHIYMRNRKSKPGGLEGLQQRLSRRRPSLSPSRFSDNAFESFLQKNEDVIDEGDVMRDVVPILCGDADIPSRQNLLFARLDPITNDTIVNAKPDFYDGARLKDIDKRVREDIGDYIIPTGHTMAPVVPNFFLEVKCPSGSTDVAKRQACYNGALGARAMHKLQSYDQDEPVYDYNAYTISTTYHDGTLKIYATHPTAGPGNSTEYHMTQLRSWALTDTPDSFRQGATIFRNARDYAQEQRDAFILAANKRARSANAEASSFESLDHNYVSDSTDSEDTGHLTAESDQYDISQPQEGYLESESSTLEESQTSADELALNTYAQPKASNNKRRRASKKIASKIPRKSDGRPGQRAIRDKFE